MIKRIATAVLDWLNDYILEIVLVTFIAAFVFALAYGGKR